VAAIGSLPDQRVLLFTVSLQPQPLELTRHAHLLVSSPALSLGKVAGRGTQTSQIPFNSIGPDF
jgi:hypothetical protein